MSIIEDVSLGFLAVSAASDLVEAVPYQGSYLGKCMSVAIRVGS